VVTAIFFDRVALEAQPSDQWMRKARAHYCLRFVKISTRVVFLERGGAERNTVDFNFSAARSAGDAELFAMRRAHVEEANR